MTDYKGPNAFSNGVFKPAKAPKIVPPYERAPSGAVRNADGPAFNNRFPKSRYPRGGGQSGLRPVLEVAGGGGGGYVGPLDLVPGAIVAYGQRAMSAALRGSAVYTIRENSGNTTQSFNSAATTGAAPAAAITAFLNGASGFVTVWNDQSGDASDMLQTDPARQPKWQPNPSLLFVAANANLLATASSVNLTNPGITTFTVMIPVQSMSGSVNNLISGEGWATSSGGMEEYWTADPGGPSGSYVMNYLSDVGGHGPVFFNTTLAEYNDGLIHVWDLALDGSMPPYAGTLFVDGESFADSSGGGDAGFNGLSWRMALGNDDATRGIGAASYFNGQMIERIVYPFAMSDADRLKIRQNMAAYYGITLS